MALQPEDWKGQKLSRAKVDARTAPAADRLERAPVRSMYVAVPF